MRLPFVSRSKYATALDSVAQQRDTAYQSGADLRASLNAKHDERIQSIIDGIAHEYYLASAIYHLSRPADPAHIIGVMDGARRAMAAVVGRDIISVGFRMEHGIPQGPEGKDWMAVVDNADTNPLHVVLHDGIREPVADRLDHLHMEALRKDGHPFYTIVTRERAEQAERDTAAAATA